MRTPVAIIPGLCYLPERFRRCNCYLLSDREQTFLFDPSFGPEAVPGNLPPVRRLFATHAHYDHIGALGEWKEGGLNPEFLLHAGDLPMLDDPKANASLFFGRPVHFKPPGILLDDGQDYEAGDDFSLRVVHTPGHTMGSSCFLVYRRTDQSKAPVAVLTGDTLFDQGWGRTDFVTGDDRLMRRSLERLHAILASLPPELPVCPGHGGLTTARAAGLFLEAAGFASS